MGADDKLKVYVTGATTAPGLALMRGLVARDHFVAGNATTLLEAKRLRASGGLPVYVDEHSARDLAGALRMTGATVIIHAAPQAANSLLPGARQEAAALAGLERGTEAVLAAAAQIDDAHLVCCSFAALYGDTKGEAVGEDAELAASGALFEAAAAMERAALESSTASCVLRAGLLYGPESASLAALWARAWPAGCTMRTWRWPRRWRRNSGRRGRSSTSPTGDPRRAVNFCAILRSAWAWCHRSPVG